MIQKIQDFLDKVYQREPFDRDKTKEMLITGKLQYFGFSNSAMICGLTNDKIMYIWAAAGDMDQLLYFLPSVEKYYWKYHQAEKSTIIGRNGWARVLAKFNYHRDGDVLTRKFEHGQENTGDAI